MEKSVTKRSHFHTSTQDFTSDDVIECAVDVGAEGYLINDGSDSYMEGILR